MKQIKEFLAKPFFSDYRVLGCLWMLLPIVMWLAKMNRANNYLIYRGSFWNAWRGWNIYMLNPAEYGDSHHYGPLFSDGFNTVEDFLHAKELIPVLLF